ncbi:hypothetical protein [Jatrophihabitans endophyticus]|uniref:hypothetical protein n=1 Tax=Jatrophihabitans endophyticus TaxID=1206085 RepID=UPI0019E7BB15|nr:hypothetical protein [Jatrophihabitans endophyticus]MBE7189756.1 hypothetical protein [Jatrophihabitans endophyticus]
MSEQASDLDRGAADVFGLMTDTSTPAPTLSLDAEAPLVTLPPDTVALIVARVQAGLSPLGPDHPRTMITRRIVVPSTALAVLDVVGLVAAAAGGHTVLAVVAAVLFVVLAYLAFAGVRFVRADPLRVAAPQRTAVDAAKTWRSGQGWTDAQRDDPWARLVGVACSDTARIAASKAWAWPSIAGQRSETELAALLDDVDAYAHAQVGSAATADSPLVLRVAALRCYADALDDLVRRGAGGEDVRDALPGAEDERLTGLLAVARTSGTQRSEPS